jgi:D-sedoheptulose 7-phosphate isomerase
MSPDAGDPAEAVGPDAASAEAVGPDAGELIRESVAALGALLAQDTLDAIARAVRTIADALRAGGKVLLFGNGGSASDATHIAAEFLGRFQRERAPQPAVALGDNTAAVTAIANDYGFEHVFARQLHGLAAAGDVAIAISTSGRSRNVLAGAAAARELGLQTIALTGGDGGELARAVDVAIVVPAQATARIQEAHILIGHVLCELVEREIA